MSGKRNLIRENEIRREQTKMRRFEKVIVGYVKAIHPAIYDEANLFHSSLNAMYQSKKDLTKTEEFRSLIKNKTTTMPNFQLKIQLLDQRTTLEMTETAAAPTPETPETTAAAPAPEMTETAAAPTPETPETTAAKTTDLLPLDDDTLGQLIADLQEDPVMMDFFANIEYEIDDCPLW